VPTLDEIARDPSRAHGLPAPTLVALATLCAAAQSVIAQAQAALLLSPQARPTRNDSPDDQMLTVEEAAAMLRQSKQWLYRHADQLPFVRRLSRKKLLCSRSGIVHWLAAHGGGVAQ